MVYTCSIVDEQGNIAVLLHPEHRQGGRERGKGGERVKERGHRGEKGRQRVNVHVLGLHCVCIGVGV